MRDVWYHLAGDIDPWPSKDEMVALLRRTGMTVVVGRYSIRIRDFENFGFGVYGGDLGEPVFAAEARSLNILRHEAERVSDALRKEGYRHRIELYDDENVLVGYLHHEWSMAK